MFITDILILVCRLFRKEAWGGGVHAPTGHLVKISLNYAIKYPSYGT